MCCIHIVNLFYLIINGFICRVHIDVSQFGSDCVCWFLYRVFSKMAPHWIAEFMVVKMMFQGCFHHLLKLFIALFTVLFDCISKIANEAFTVYLLHFCQFPFQFHTLITQSKMPLGSMALLDSVQFLGHLCLVALTVSSLFFFLWSSQVQHNFDKTLYATTFLVQPPQSIVCPLCELYVICDPCHPVSPLQATGTCPSTQGKMPEATVASTSFHKFSAQHCPAINYLQ